MKIYDKHEFKINRTTAIGLVGVLAVATGLAVYSAEKNNNHNKSESATATQANTPKSQAELSQLCAEKLPLNYLAGQVLMLGIRSEDAGELAPVFHKYQIGGAVVMVAPPLETSTIINDFKTRGSSRGVPVLISTDEEGGRVQRFSNLGVLPAPYAVANSTSSDNAEKIIENHGQKMHEMGVDMVLGPLADVAPQDGGGPLGDRVFSSDPYTVTKYDLAYLNGWLKAGLKPTLKHFPGLGSASANTDYEPAVTPPFNQLKQRDLIPYQIINQPKAAVMVGNQVVPGLTDIPASLNPKVIKLLRNKYGYKNNLIVSDSIDAASISKLNTPEQATVFAIKAGDDIVIDTADQGKLTDAILAKDLTSAIKNAVGNHYLSKKELADSVARKLGAQGINACQIK